MASVNKAIILGNLGRDPEVRYSADGAAICNLSVATSYTWRGADGGRQEKTEWHRVVLFGRLAEVAGEYLRKGRPIYIEGRIETRKWQDKDTGQDRYSTEIVGTQMQMLGGRDDSDSQGARPQDGQQNAYAQASQSSVRAQAPAGGLNDMDDDIPF